MLISNEDRKHGGIQARVLSKPQGTYHKKYVKRSKM